jgi:hypothetical protein
MQTCPQLQAVITELAAVYQLDLMQPGASLRLDLPGYDRLCIECIGPRRIAVAHYFEQSGDLVAEPEIVFWVDPQGAWVPVEITQSLTGWRRCVELSDDGATARRFQPRAQRDLAGFAEFWAQNLRQQGWLAHGIRFGSRQV